MSTTVVTLPIVSALVTAEDVLGPKRQWNATNPTQARFLAEFFLACREEIGIAEIESLASWSAEEINQFLAERGFSIELEPFDQDTFGVASVLNLLVEWLHEGKISTIMTPDEQTYPGVLLSGEGTSFLTSPGRRNPIARLATKSGDTVFITVLDSPPEGFDLVGLTKKLLKGAGACGDYGGLIFPMVDLDQQINLDWLLGMWTKQEPSSRRAFISQALQQTILKMNEKGARAKSAVAIAVTLECFTQTMPNYVVDRPFLMWIEREGMSRPLFVGHITPEDWKNPGSLGE